MKLLPIVVSTKDVKSHGRCNKIALLMSSAATNRCARFGAGVGTFQLLPHGKIKPDQRWRSRNFVGKLPQDQREVLTMRKISGLSADQVARATSSTARAVKRRLARAYERSRRLLAPATIPQS